MTAVRGHLRRSGDSELTVEAVQDPVQESAEVLDDCDAVVGCVDSVTARSFCNEYVVVQPCYYLDAGVRIDTPDPEEADPADEQAVEMTGYVHPAAPGSNAWFGCPGRHDQAAARIEQMSSAERDADRERGYIDDEELAPEPVVIHLTGQCASKPVSALVSLTTGGSILPESIRYDDHAHEMTELTTGPSDECPTCGPDGVLGVGRWSFDGAHFEPDSEPTVSD